MRMVTNWRHVEELFGVCVLTGESCAYSLRLLCDLNEAGAKLIRAYFGLPPACELEVPWNNTVAGKPSVASVMLARGSLEDLAVFGLLHTGSAKVVRAVEKQRGMLTGIFGFAPGEEDEADRLAESLGEAHHVYRHSVGSGPQAGGRNVHQMTGRTS